MRLINWNIERRGPHTWQAASLVSEMAQLKPDLIFLTEGHVASLESLGGNTLNHRGYRSDHKVDTERLVSLWSLSPWVELFVPPELARKGGIVAGETLVRGQAVSCVCICIPYHMARLPHESATRPWQHHIEFLEALRPWLKTLAERVSTPLLIAGDFNRRLPSLWGNKSALVGHQDCFAGFEIPTLGLLEPLKVQTIDHAAVRGAKAKRVRLLERREKDGRPRSDHHGVIIDFEM